MVLYLRVTPSAAGRLSAIAGDRTAAIDEAMSALVRGDSDEASLNARVLEAGGVDALIHWHHIVATARDENLLDYSLRVNGAWMATAEPLASGFEPPSFEAPDPAATRLSRFAYLRYERGRILLESPLASVRLELSPEAAAIALDAPVSADATVVSALIAMLHQFGFHERLDREPPPAERVWEFHDALFHHGSRLTAPNTGATCRFRDELPPWPALKARGAQPRIALSPQDLAAIAHRDPPFTDVLERRRSIRTASATLTLPQLSELLFRTLRICNVERASEVETIRKVVPAGGGLHELEAYLAVRHCDGLEAGCYWYDADAHALVRLDATGEMVAAFVDQAERSWRRRHPAPDVLITFAARVPRVAWSYERMAYRVVLMNAGAVMQTMYLVATAMGLAPCAVGNGDPDLFARLTGLDPFDETSVGEFALSGTAAP
jgi:SagB-type dehydrogenase family enzyme